MSMNNNEIRIKLTELRNLTTESEVVEFKGSVNDNFSTSDIGKYFSALANEASLRGHGSAWMVFGVDDDDHRIVGTTYRKSYNNREGFGCRVRKPFG